MRKRSIFYVFYCLLIVSNLKAASVGINKAFVVASNFTIENSLDLQLEKNNVEILFDRNDGDTLAFVFSGFSKGFLVISAIDNLAPVVAYSNENRFVKNSPLGSLLLADLGMRSANINKISNGESLKNKAAWDRLQRNGCKEILYEQWPPAGATTTGGWTITKWNQTAPYNNFCPIKLSNQQRSLTGCPATAMAQILVYQKEMNGTRFNQNDRYYHNYTQAFWIDDTWETYSYLSFDSLNVYLDSLEQKFETGASLNNDDKAALSLACGFACKSVFDPAGSGTFSVSQAYEAYLRFGFESAVLLDSQFSDEQIKEKMIDNIKNANPVHLATVDPAWSSGHNVVCDGYRDNGFFRLNMGWGGSYDNWYNLPAGFPLNLTVFEGIVADIQKNDTTLYSLNLTAVPDSIGAVLHGNGENTEGEFVMISVETVSGYVFDKWTGSAADVALLNNETSQMPFFNMPARNVSLTANFVKPLFLVSFNIYGPGFAGIQGAVITVDSLAESLVTDQDGYAFTQLENGVYDFLIQASGYQDYTGSFTVQSDAVNVAVNMQASSVHGIEPEFLIGPNPLKDVLEIKNSGNILRAKLCTIDGKIIFFKQENQTGSLQIPVSNLSNGSYILYILTDNGLEIKKLLIK